MNNGSKLLRIQVTLESARREINQGNGRLALRALRSIKDEIRDFEGTVDSLEFSLTAAEAFLTDRDASAETHLLEAAEKLSKLGGSHPNLAVRVYERLGDFYATIPPKDLGRAREYLSHAKKAAVLLGVEEVTANISLKIISVELRINKRPENSDFRTLRRVAKAEGYTPAEQLMTWSCYIGNLEESKVGLQFARGMAKASEDYFRELLRSVRETENERLGE